MPADYVDDLQERNLIISDESHENENVLVTHPMSSEEEEKGL